MKESCEHIINVGFKRSPETIFDEVESVSASMIREGWVLSDNFMEEGLAKIHLFFERTIEM